MENIESIIRNPTTWIVVVPFIIMKYFDKLQLIFPNTQKRIDNLMYSKSLNSSNQMLANFIDDQIRRMNFSNATGLSLNERNVKLLTLYDRIKEQITWKEFLKIKQYIKKPDHFETILTTRTKWDIYFSCGFWVLLFIIGFWKFSILGYKYSQPNQIVVTITDFILPCICLIISELMFIWKKEELKIIKRYDFIVGATNHED